MSEASVIQKSIRPQTKDTLKEDFQKPGKPLPRRAETRLPPQYHGKAAFYLRRESRRFLRARRSVLQRRPVPCGSRCPPAAAAACPAMQTARYTPASSVHQAPAPPGSHIRTGSTPAPPASTPARIFSPTHVPSP